MDAVVLSNHGGRQLDRAPTPLELLPDVLDAVGDRCEVLIDSGVRSGADLVAARAMGASAAMVGRAYLYGLMAGGEAGVDRALEIFQVEATRTLQLLGVARADHLGPSHARLRGLGAARGSDGLTAASDDSGTCLPASGHRTVQGVNTYTPPVN